MNRNLVGFLFFVAAVILGFGILLPQFNTLRGVTLERNARVAIAEKKQKRFDALQSLTTVFQEQSGRINTIISTLPTEPDVPEALVSLEAIASQNGVTLDSLVPQVNTRKQELVVTMRGEGDLAAIERVMQGIADNNRPMSVTRVSLSRKQEGSRIAFTISVLMPYIGQSKTTAR